MFLNNYQQKKILFYYREFIDGKKITDERFTDRAFPSVN